MITYDDSDEKLKIRLEIMNLEDARLKEFRGKAAQAKSKDELMALMKEIDLSDLNNKDITEIFYALGPNILSKLIEQMLSEVEDDDEMEQIVAVSTMRHLLFGS